MPLCSAGRRLAFCYEAPVRCWTVVWSRGAEEAWGYIGIPTRRYVVHNLESCTQRRKGGGNGEEFQLAATRQDGTRNGPWPLFQGINITSPS